MGIWGLKKVIPIAKKKCLVYAHYKAMLPTPEMRIWPQTNRADVDCELNELWKKRQPLIS
jgi:hypothetical protein